MSEVLKFEATWLYDAHGHSKLCTTEGEYADFLAQGWMDTPAAFQIETHPSNPVQPLAMGDGAAMLQQLGIPAPFSPSQNWEEMMAMLQQMQAMLDGHAAMLAAVVDRIEVMEAQLTAPEEPSVPDKGGRK